METLYVNVDNLKLQLHLTTERERLEGQGISCCFRVILEYEERQRNGSTESAKGVLSTLRCTVINLLAFLDPESNSQFGMAMTLMEMPISQIRHTYPEEKISWYEVAWILLWKIQEIHEKNPTRVFLLPK